MEILSFGYVGIATAAISDWPELAQNLLGFQIVERTKTFLSLRMDDRRQRVFIDQSLAPGAHVFGWEVANSVALDGLAARLEDAGVSVTREPSAFSAQRGVREVISFYDPSGNRLEVFHGPDLSTEPFRPGRAISGFRTGALGLGHVALMVKSFDRTYPFYRDILGFELSDYVRRPFRANFMHVNARHHSLALIEAGEDRIHHLMFELFSLDDVGQGYDIALVEKNRIGVTLGRHTNDYMTSFYVNMPSGLLVEYGWGGRDVEDGQPPAELVEGPSFWGHERSWLSPEGRAEALQMRLDAGRRGVRAPVQVIDGNYHNSRGSCPWWDGLAASAAHSR